MKKIFFSFAAVLFAATTFAQGEQTLMVCDDYSLSVIPKDLVKTGSSRIYFQDENLVTLYNNQFIVDRNITVTPFETTRISIAEERIPNGYTYYLAGNNGYGYDAEKLYDLPAGWTYTSVLDILNEYFNWVGSWRFSQSSQFEGLSNIYLPLDLETSNGIPNFFDYHGDTLPVCIAYIRNTPDGDELWYTPNIPNFLEATPIYNGDNWQILYADTTTNEVFAPSYFDYVDADIDAQHVIPGIFLTQTLFNNDDNYEYVRLIPSSSPMSFEASEWDQPSHEGVKYTHASTVAIGFEIVSENGNVLQSVTFSNGFHSSRYYEGAISVLKIDNMYYLLFYGTTSNKDTRDTILLYRVTNSSTPIQQVSAPIANTVLKYLKSGHMYIDNGKHVYSTTGMHVK